MKNVPKCERCGTLPRQEEADMGDETWYCECDYVSPTARAARRKPPFKRLQTSPANTWWATDSKAPSSGLWTSAHS